MPDRPLLRVPVSRAAQIACWAAAVAAVGVAALWALPLLLTRHPSSGLTVAERLSAVNDVRSVLVTFLLAAGATGGLLFTARTFRLSRETQLTDRFIRAVSQIGDGSLEVRIGGIYALERIGRDSAADRHAVVYVLGAMVRHRSRDLRNANLQFMHGTQVHLGGADLAGAKLPDDWNAWPGCGISRQGRVPVAAIRQPPGLRPHSGLARRGPQEPPFGMPTGAWRHSPRRAHIRMIGTTANARTC